MALNTLVDSRDMRFVLFEMLRVDGLGHYDKFADFDRDTYEATLELAEKIAMEQVYPCNADADKKGVVYDPGTGSVTTPDGFRPAMKFFNEAGFSGLCSDPRWGGMGMPEVIYRAVIEYFFAASISFASYISLKVGASNLVVNFASDDLKKIYLEKMISGRWGGTMCLTEPDAGSDVGAIKTRAVRQSDGTFLIFGQKIFITAGENDLFENIIHPVLARIEGDPPGTGGISIFLVPKYHVKPNGTIGERNDVVCSGVEHKMGIRGSATCTLNFGDNGKCVGYLMGSERQGMKIMFQMMNEARLDVAEQGLGVASSAYLHAVTYANHRVQGSDPSKKSDPTCRQAPIICHPDVRRMLLWMKAHVEAMRMITMLAAYSEDMSHVEKDEKMREAKALVDFLIPICKAGNTDLAWLVTSEAIQVFGGYGYCADYPVEQLARDSKILAIYEGTNGIQSIDLAMRKLLMNPDQYNYGVYKKRMRETIESARGIVQDTYVSSVESGLEKMDETIRVLLKYKETGKILDIFAIATPLQQAFRMLSHAWVHLWSLTICVPRLKGLAGDMSLEKLNALARDDSEAAYYYGKVLSSRYYLGSEFKKYFGFLDYIASGEGSVVEAVPEVFTGAPAE
jgi:alkylation response protein AidB-like acyl-CoA dehydrogenase